MHVVLICTSVIVQLHSVLSTTTQDITSRCVNNENIKFFLTYAEGTLDRQMVKTSGENQLDCSIEFQVMESHYVIGVLKFLPSSIKQKVCINKAYSVITVSDFRQNDCGSELPSLELYTVTNKSRLLISFENLQGILLYVSVTSMRDPGNYKCSQNTEVECDYDDKTYCMDEVFFCDGYPDCGVPNAYDEDLEKCQGLKLTPYMIFCVILMQLMTLVLIASLFFTLLPKRKETLVYKFDPSMPLFDTDNGLLSYDIDIIILFPKEQKALTATKSILIKK